MLDKDKCIIARARLRQHVETITPIGDKHANELCDSDFAIPLVIATARKMSEDLTFIDKFCKEE